MIFYDMNSKTFFLEGERVSYVFRIEKGRLRHMYFGKRIARDDLGGLFPRTARSFSPNQPPAEDDETYSTDTMMMEYDGFGEGDFRSPAVTVTARGSAMTDFRYVSHAVSAEKPKPDGLPAVREGETLTVTLKDDVLGLELKLFYTVFDDGVARRAEIFNFGGESVEIGRFMSASLDVVGSDFVVTELTGRYVVERCVRRTPLRGGIYSLSSLRGATSHQRSPFIAVADGTATEEHGDVIGAQLVYSGNFLIEAEADAFGNIRINGGIHPMFSGKLLHSGERFVSPEMLFVFSDGGYGGMSRAFSDLLRNNLINPAFAFKPRPIVLNNWESTYFDFDAQKICSLIEKVKGLGIDTFVLDDGWFGHRDDDSSSLGDWFVDRRKFPKGLSQVADCCKKSGMKFGLWFEPEMISKDSELYRDHPDWCIHTEGRGNSLSRRQYVLDFSRSEVVDEIFRRMQAIVSEYGIAYIKWDMNRHLTNVPETRLYHEYVLGVYRLYEMLQDCFPDLFIEGCSGGGGRFDAGILYYSPQIWTSDNTDAYSRAFIQYGTSYAFPLSAISNHVSICPNHQTGRITPFYTRANIAFLGAFGYELNPFLLTDGERKDIAAQTAKYREIEDLVLHGDLYRLVSPFETGDFAAEIVSKDSARAFAVYLHSPGLGNPSQRYLKFKGLDADLRYTVEETGESYHGSTLMSVGLPVPFERGDYDSFAVTLKAER